MKAMILAAGRGERLRPLTDELPKPLIKVAGRSLIEYHLLRLAAAGIKEIIINTAWLAEKIHQRLGDGANYGVCIKYSDEGTALETAGGIINALPALGEDTFLVINGDIYCEFELSTITGTSNPVSDKRLTEGRLAHLVLVDNPPHNTAGDFSLQHGLIKNTGRTMHTFSGIGLYHPDFFAAQAAEAKPLAPITREKCEQDLVSGEYYDGSWTDVGTIERLNTLDRRLKTPLKSPLESQSSNT